LGSGTRGLVPKEGAELEIGVRFPDGVSKIEDIGEA
jgi:hypothetical protein